MVLGWLDSWLLNVGWDYDHSGGFSGVFSTAPKQWYLESPFGDVVTRIHNEYFSVDGWGRDLCACYRSFNGMVGDNVSFSGTEII